MPIYYFDVFDDETLWTDEFGVELDEPREVSDHARALLPDSARDKPLAADRHDIRVRVRDEASTVVYDATLTIRAGWIKPEDG